MMPSKTPKETISINEASLHDVCKRINDHLSLYSSKGWIVGSALAGKNNINTYSLSKGSENIFIAFDLSPSAHVISADPLSFTIVSMAMGKSNAERVLFELQDRVSRKKTEEWNQKYGPYIPITILIVVAIIIASCSGKL